MEERKAVSSVALSPSLLSLMHEIKSLVGMELSRDEEERAREGEERDSGKAINHHREEVLRRRLASCFFLKVEQK
jgi:hypothetical protein